MFYVHCSSNTRLLNRSLFAVAHSRRGLTVNAVRWSEPLGGWTGSTGLHTLQLTTALGVRSWTVSAHCSRPNMPSTGNQLSQNPDMTPEHCGRGSTACCRRLQTQTPPLPLTRCTNLSHFSGVKSMTSGSLHWLLHLLIFRSDLQTACHISPVSCSEVAKIIASMSSKSCSLDPMPTWLVKKTRDVLVPVICNLCNATLRCAVFPVSQKQAIVFPRPKKSTLDPDHLTSYNNNLRFYLIADITRNYYSNRPNIRHAGRDTSHTTAATQGSTIYRRVKPAKLLPHMAHSD